MTLTRGPVKKCITFWFSVCQCDHALLSFVAVIEKHLLDPIQVMYVRHARACTLLSLDPPLVDVKLHFKTCGLDLVNFSLTWKSKSGLKNLTRAVHNRNCGELMRVYTKLKWSWGPDLCSLSCETKPGDARCSGALWRIAPRPLVRLWVSNTWQHWRGVRFKIEPLL